MAADLPDRRKPRRRLRKWLIGLGAMFVALLVLVAMIPTLVSWGIGQGFVRNAIERNINGSVEIDRMQLGWFSEQNVNGVHITYPDGQNAADLSVRLNRGLLSLMIGGSEPIEVTIAGEVNGHYKDGKLSFAELLRQDGKPAGPNPPSKPSTEPFTLPEIPGVTVRISSLDFNFNYVDANQSIQLQGLKGSFSYVEPAQPITIDLQGQTNVNDVAGAVTIQGQADDLFDAGRRLSLRAASAKLDVLIESIPLTTPTQSAHIQRLAINLASDDLTGKIALTVNGNGQINGREPSTFALNAGVSNVLNSRGELSLRGGGASINLQAQNLPILDQNVNGVVRTLNASLISADLTQQLDIGVEGDTQIEGNAPTPLLANLSIKEPFTPEGQPQLARLDRITGAARGQAIPTAVLQPFLPEPLNASRDIGSTVDVEARFGGADRGGGGARDGGGETGERRNVSLTAIGPKARLELTADVNPTAAEQAITGSHLLLTAPAADPVLVKHYTSLTVDRPTDVEIRLTSFSLPPKDSAADARPKQLMAATGTLQVKGPTTVLLAAPAQAAERGALAGTSTPIELQNLNVRLETPGLGQFLIVQGSADIDGAAATFNQHITNLFNRAGELDATNALAAGEFKINGLPPATLAKFAPQQREFIDQTVGDGLALAMISTVNGSDMNIELNAKAQAFDVRATATKRPDAVNILSTLLQVNLTPELAAALQRNSEKPILIAEPTAISIDLSQIDLVKSEDGAFALADQPITGSLTVNDVVVQNAPGLAEPLGVRELVAQLSRQREGSYESYFINGDVTLQRVQADRLLGRARYQVKVNTRQTGDSPREVRPHADIGFTELSIRHLERMLAMERGTVSQWTGDKGELSVHVEGELGSTLHANLRSALPNLKGDFKAETDMNMVTVTAQTSTLSLSREAVEKRLNPPPPKPATDAARRAAEDEPPATPANITMANDVPMALEVRTLNFPLAMAKGEQFDPAQVKVDVRLTGGPITLINPDQERTSVSDLSIALNAANLAEGLTFAIKGKTESTAPLRETPPAGRGGPEGTIGRSMDEQHQPAPSAPIESGPGDIDITGKLVGFLSESGTLDADAAKLQMTANVKRMPTAIADAFADMKGLLVAAVGHTMDATFVANDFSVSSGTLDARIDATNGWLEAPLRGREHAFRTKRDQPIRAELAITPALRNRLLQTIHPILADIRTTEQPLRVNLPLAVAPLKEDSHTLDVSQFKADIEVTVGKVELDSGSKTLSVLRFFGEAEQRETIPGEIEPIRATIRDGVVKYQKFSVHVDKYTLNYSGEIDLVKSTVDLRTEVPLQALGQAVRELEPYADKIVVPLVTRGTFGDLKTQIDPKFDLGKAALNAGFRGSLQELLEGRGSGSLGDLLEGIRKKKNE